ncbi:MAG: outer membrane protein [Phormidesmis sp.]
MSAKKVLLGSMGLLLLVTGAQLPVRAQTVLESLNPVAESAPTDEQPINGVRELEQDELNANKSKPAEAMTAELMTDELSAEEPAMGDELADSSNELPAMTAEAIFDEAELEATQPENFSPENLSADSLALGEGATPVLPTADATELTYPTAEDPAEIAQARRRTRNAVSGSSDFIGIGADFGTADDVSFAVISKLSLSDQIAVRPSVLVGNDFALLVPVTYEFSRFTTNVEGFRILPYAGVGASYVGGNDSNFGLLLSAGVDVPVARQFTANAQANYSGLFSDSDNFGVTIGVGYNFGGFR